MMLHRKKRRYILPYFLVIVIHLLFHSVYPLLGYDSSNVTLQGKTAGGTPVDVVADGNYAYVAASVFIAIYDISNPADPIQLSILPTDNNASDIKLSGNYLYVADSSGGLRIIDVTDKSNPVETGYYYESYETSPGFGVANVVLGVEVSGNYAYITEARNEGEEAGLKVIDITSKSSPIQAGHASTPEAYDLKLDDTYAYVVDYSSGLFVIDISAPASPSVAGYLSMDQGAKQIDISGNYAYIVNSGAGTDLRGLQVVDISNPFSPVAVSTWGISGLIYPDGVFISGTKAYIGYDTSGLYVIDISDPLNPAELGHYDSSGHARRAFVSDSTAYLADRESFLILNVSNPASITKLGEYITPSLGTSLAISGSYAYLGDSGKTALCVIDISQPAQPQLVEISDYAGTPNDLAISGNYICVAGGTADLRILNISNPLNVTQASLLSLAGEASGIDIYGNYACVAAKNGGVRIVDISNPLSPFEYNSFFTPFTTTSDIYDVRISSHYAYCVDYSSGLLVFDISDPANPDNVAVLSSAKKAKSIYIDGDYAYTCHDYYSGIEGSIQIFDISRPTSPVKTGYYNTGDYPNNVRVENGFAYVANGSYKGLTILDVSDPVNPLLAGYYSTPGSANDALPAGDKVYVADSGSGFWSFEFLQRYALSGYVKNSSGTAVPSMDVALSGKSSAGMKTDSNGFFEFTALSTGTYTVTVSSQNFTVLPLSRTLLVDKSSRDINFQADLNTYTITGTIETPSGDPLNGFAVALSRILDPDTTQTLSETFTDQTGAFLFNNVQGNGNYRVEPSSTGYSFSPQSVSTYTLSGNLNLAFRADTSTYTIYGTVGINTSTGAFVGVAGVTLSLTGTSSSSTVTVQDGYYEFPGLAYGGNFTVTPDGPGYTFSPSSLTVTALQSDELGNFTASVIPVLSVSATSLDFGEVKIGESRTETFTVTNSTGGTLSGTISADNSWISVTPASFSSNNFNVNVTVTTTGLAKGAYTGTVTVASNGGNAAIQIKLTPTCALPAPNPFLLQPGITQMKFLGTGVPFARICIFTLNGDRVAELNEQSGSSELSWDGRNSAGDYVTTGIYFYTAENAEEKNNRGQFTVIRR